MKRTFVGFGFGPIQAGLFVFEAQRSGRFDRMVVAEVLPDLVAAVRRAGGCYHVNVATRQGIVQHAVTGVEMLNPAVPSDRESLIEACAEATELCTALPSVDLYNKGPTAPAAVLADAFARRTGIGAPSAVLYAAENHNQAAELLAAAVHSRRAEAAQAPIQFLNTVIGKMSGVIRDADRIARLELAPVAPGDNRAFLVEEFHHILIERIHLPGFSRALSAFEEHPNLLPFEEAKLYGHNCIHALLGYLAHRNGLRRMSDVHARPHLVELARAAFLEESGPPLIRSHAGVAPLFSASGWRAYAEDLLDRMLNPWLEDSIDRVIRDPRRKLGWDDRFIGAMRRALDVGVEPHRIALGAAAALAILQAESHTDLDALLQSLWPEPDEPVGRKKELRELLDHAKARLGRLAKGIPGGT